MCLIQSLRRPKSVEELRVALNLLLNDHFEEHALIDLQSGNAIEYRDNGNGDDEPPVEADIVIIDSYRHSYAHNVYRKWQDHSEPDDYEAESKRKEAESASKPDPEALRIDALLTLVANDEERHFVEGLRRYLDIGFTSGQLIRRMFNSVREDDPKDVLEYDPKAIGDRVPALSRMVRSKIADFLETGLDRRVVAVHSELKKDGGASYRIDFKPPKKNGVCDHVWVTITPG